MIFLLKSNVKNDFQKLQNFYENQTIEVDDTKSVAPLPQSELTSEVLNEQAVSQNLSNDQEKINENFRPEPLIINEGSIFKSIRNERLRTSLFTCPSARDKQPTRFSSAKSKQSSHQANVESLADSDNNESEEKNVNHPMVIESTSEMAKIIVNKVLEVSLEDILKEKMSEERKSNTQLKNFRYSMSDDKLETRRSRSDYYKGFNSENGKSKVETESEDEDEKFQIEFHEEPSEYLYALSFSF